MARKNAFYAQSGAFPPFKNGLQDYVRLQNVATPKKLTSQFAI